MNDAHDSYFKAVEQQDTQLRLSNSKKRHLKKPMTTAHHNGRQNYHDVADEEKSVEQQMHDSW